MTIGNNFYKIICSQKCLEVPHLDPPFYPLSRRLTNFVVSEYRSYYTNRLFQTDYNHGGFVRMADDEAGAI